MSRRASLLAKSNKERPRVRFSDEIVFQDSVKENDIPFLLDMLRRNSLQMDINTINTSGLSALHQAVCDGNFAAVKLLLNHHADVNLFDEDTWTPLHAACANGFSEIARLLIERGADPHLMNDEGERPIDLADPTDFQTIGVMLQHMNNAFDDQNDPELEDVEGREEDGVNELPGCSDTKDRGDITSEVSEENDQIGKSNSSSKLERISSRYLDSDDDNVEYISEEDEEDKVSDRRNWGGDDDDDEDDGDDNNNNFSNRDDYESRKSDIESDDSKRDSTLRRSYHHANRNVDNSQPGEQLDSDMSCGNFDDHGDYGENHEGENSNYSSESGFAYGNGDDKILSNNYREEDTFGTDENDSENNSVFDGAGLKDVEYSDVDDGHFARCTLQSGEITESDVSGGKVTNRESSVSCFQTESSDAELFNLGRGYKSSEDETGYENFPELVNQRENEIDVMMASHIAVKADKSGRLFRKSPST